MSPEEILAAMIKDPEIGIPTVEDTYTGRAETYITFTFEDERPGLCGDDNVAEEIAYIQVTLWTPQSEDYRPLKNKIKKYLRNHGFNVNSVQTFLEDITGAEKLRHVVFSTTINI